MIKWIDNRIQRPEKDDIYWVTLSYEGWDEKKNEPNGVRDGVAVDTRWFGNAYERGSGAWVMDGEPEEGLVWTEECGSYPKEHVEAWAPMESIEPFVREPDGKKENV